MLWWTQLRAVLRKNLLLSIRKKRNLAREIGFPVVFLAALVAIRSSLSNTEYDFAPASAIEFVSVSQFVDTVNSHLSSESSTVQNSNWYVGIAPASVQHTLSIGTDLVNAVGNATVVRYFDSATELQHAAVNNKETLGEMMLGISFFSSNLTHALATNTTIQYNIYMNRSVVSLPDTTWLFDTVKWGTAKQTKYNQDAFLNSGFLFAQQLIDRSIVAFVGGDAAVNFATAVQTFPYPAFTTKDAQNALQYTMPFYLLLVFSIQVRTALTNILEEKEKKLREGMVMVGLKPWVNQLSWLITNMAKTTIVIIVVVPLGISSHLFEGCDGVLLFIFFWLFALATSAFTFLIATFFSSAQNGGLLGYLIYFALSTPAAIIVSRDDISSTGKVGSCILSPCAFFLGTRIINDVQGGTGAGKLNWSNVSEPSVSDMDVAFGSVLWMLLVDVVVYFFLAWYIGNVWPNEYGTTLPWNFPFMREYWFSNDTQQTSHRRRRGSNISPKSSFDPAGQQSLLQSEPTLPQSTTHQQLEGHQRVVDGGRGLGVVNLTKVFKRDKNTQIRAVDEVSWDAFEDQVTVLLGHNGAGKSVTISMLTGLYPPTSGDAVVAVGNGSQLSIVRNMNKVRKSLGVCPQHDILWDDLTVEEHLTVFAGIKGLPTTDRARKVFDMMKRVDLHEKRHEKAIALSGGMKRRLSVAMALIGDPKVVFLDEPTSGMDPEGRRHIWDLVKDAKQNKVVILTTHFMDEADLLGDRIAIMAQGKVRVMGSSLFLKNRYGIGYHLNIVKKDGFSSPHITQLVQQHVPEAKLLNDTAGDFCMILPLSSASQFYDLFSEFDAHMEENGMSSYGVSVTTLEEVFLKLADEFDHQQNTEADNISASEHSHAATADDEGTYRTFGVRGSPSIERQTKALLAKRLRMAKRNKRALFFQFGLPVIFLMISASFGNLTSITHTTSLAPVSLAPKAQFPEAVQNTDHHFTKPFEFRIAAPQSTSPAFSTKTGTTSVNDLLQRMPAVDGALNAPSYLSQSAYDQIVSKNATNPFSLLGEYNLAVVDFAGRGNANLTIAYNSSSFTCLPMALTSITGAWLQSIKGLAPSNQNGIEPTFVPFSRVEGESTGSDPGAFAAASSTVIYMSFGMISIVGIAITNVVRDKETKIKQQLWTSGTQPLAYWLAYYAFDLLFYTLPLAGVIVVVQAFSLLGLDGDHILGTFLLFLGFGFAAMPMAYACSFFFQEASTATTVSLLAQSFLNIALLVAFIVFSIPDLVSVPALLDVIQYVGYLFPNFALSAGLYKLSSAYALCDTLRSIDPNENWKDCSKSDNFLGPDMILPNVLYLFGDAVLFSLITIYLERRAWTKLVQSHVKTTVENTSQHSDDDEDVKAEESRVRAHKSQDVEASNQNEDLIRIVGLNKVYENSTLKRPAVRNLTLGIPRGQCFGLLGPNGAGKTTTMAMLTGAVRPTGGSATLADHDIVTNLPRVFQNIGFCPQHDALDELLTVREELELYGHLKGVPKHDLPYVVTHLLERTTLTPHANKLTKELSGGNKRKLSLAIALIGNPRIVFLDEPSTGMDPKARRAMWGVISDITKGGRAVVLTTHLMEECEALCQRIGILVKGRLACVGTAQHLKSRFGKGYRVEISVSDSSRVPDVRAFITKLTPGAQESECYGNHIKFELPRLGISLGHIFREIEQHKQELTIEDYSVSQTTLEQVFMRFAKAQQEEADQLGA